MTVDWHGFAVVTAALFTLLILTGLRRGRQGVFRMSFAIGAAVTIMGLVTGSVFAIVGGVVIVAVVCWARSV